ncbi:hypothetical protein [Agromyces aerolatus]|uniref:hypothetical protein n=1 Tax=Agromyces sp. LY-1074 TaxID=3074080 RepID=UPI0028627C4C|nr:MULTISPECIES: hypothetical protein [unclassified Agromyces]MDR5698415.1 hypothetical protein [Agromyces sp. LY-1074]MDR5704709.1 hypothetical protein [Agromyces sp. LY-1358]
MTESAFVEGEPTAEQQRLIDVGTELFRRIQPEATPGFRLLPDDDAVLVVSGTRGGGSIFVAADESALFAASAVAPHVALEAFRAGKRTPKEKFVRPEAAGR